MLTFRSSITGDIIIGTAQLGDLTTISSIKNGDVITVRSQKLGILRTITSNFNIPYFRKANSLLSNHIPKDGITHRDNTSGVKGNTGKDGITHLNPASGVKGNTGKDGISVS